MPTVSSSFNATLFTSLKFPRQKSDNNNDGSIKKCILKTDMASYRFDNACLEKETSAGFFGDAIHHKISAAGLTCQRGELNPLCLVPVNSVIRR
jgi:hypothetical protein